VESNRVQFLVEGVNDGGQKMKLRLFVAALSLATSPVLAGAVHPSQAITSVGQNVIVEGIAHIQDGAGGGAAIELTGGGDGHLTVVIPEQVKTTLPDLASYEGKTVDVTGTVAMVGRWPQITISRASQLKVASP
jgi:DNA/RNA endonuclease YhcR with UshA esterase domain